MNSATVAECNLDLLQNAKHSDVVFIVGASKERISCHQLFLMARSPVFEVMFADRWTKSRNVKDTLCIQEPDVEPSVFRQFLHFIYGDIFTTEIAEAIRILHVAHKYQVIPLIQKCELLMKTGIKLEDSIEIYQTARHFDLASLKREAADLMANGFSKLVNDHSFKSIDEASLLALLSRDDLAIDELLLFNALLRWSCQKGKSATPRPSDQRKILAKLLPLVRFPLMKTQDFAMSVISKNILTAEESVKIFTYMNSDPGARAGLRAKLGFPWELRRGAGTEHAIKFYDSSPVVSHSHYLVSRPNHNETIQFSLQWKNVNSVRKSSPQLNSVALASVVLRGPNYATNSYDNYGSPVSIKSSWIVCMQVKKRISTTASSNADWNCLFEKKNVEIFSQQDTVVVIESHLDLETNGQYQIYVSFCGAVSLSHPQYSGTENLTGTRFFATHTQNSGISLSELKIFSESGSTVQQQDYYCGSSQSKYCSHCIRSMKLRVCAT